MGDVQIRFQERQIRRRVDLLLIAFMKRKKKKSYPISPPQSQKMNPPATDQVPRPAALPGEFENHEALVFGCNALIQTYPQVFVDFVRVAIVPHMG